MTDLVFNFYCLLLETLFVWALELSAFISRVMTAPVESFPDWLIVPAIAYAMYLTVKTFDKVL